MLPSLDCVPGKAPTKVWFALAIFDPVVRESTPSIIAGKLRTAIGRGQIPAGSQLVETELARELGVSRGPLREAMQRLTQEGLLISIRNRGIFVITMTEEEVRDMYVARTAVERAAAELILAKNGGKAVAAQLSRVVKAMKKAADKTDLDAMSEADMEYHSTLVSAAESPRLTRIHNTLLTDEFGPMVRYCFILTDAELEASEVKTPHLCDKCGKCVKGCPGKAEPRNTKESS